MATIEELSAALVKADAAGNAADAKAFADEIRRMRSTPTTAKVGVDAIPGERRKAPAATAAPESTQPASFTEQLMAPVETAVALGTSALSSPIVEGAKILGTLTSGKYGTQEGIKAGEAMGQRVQQFFQPALSPTAQRQTAAISNALASTGLQGVPIGVVNELATLAPAAIRQIAAAVKVPLDARAAQIQTQRVRESQINAPRIDAAKDALELGIALDPAVSNPTRANVLKSRIVGTGNLDAKLAEQNLPKYTAAAKQDLGLPETVKLNTKAFEQARSAPEVNGPYEAVRAIPQLTPDATVMGQLDSMRVAPLIGDTGQAAAANSLLDAVKQQIAGGVDGSTLVDSIRQRRREAQAIYNQQSKGITPPSPEALAKADMNMGVANVLESLVENNLGNNPTLLGDFRNARAKLAKTYDYERATNFATGQIDPQVIAKMAEEGKPLSGTLAKIGNVAANFPEVSRGDVSKKATWGEKLTRSSPGGTVGALLGAPFGLAGSIVGGASGAALGNVLTAVEARRMATPGYQAARAVPKDYRPIPSGLTPADINYAPGQMVPYNFGQQTFEAPNFVFGQPGAQVTPSGAGVRNALPAPSAEGTLNALRAEDVRRAGISRAVGQEAEAQQAAAEAAARQPARGGAILEVDPVTGKVTIGAEGGKGITPATQVIESTGHNLRGAADLLAAGKSPALMTAEQKIAWDKTKVDLAEIAPGFAKLGDKAIAAKMQDRAWVQDALSKAQDKARAFADIAARAENERARQAALMNRERMMDLAEQLQDALGARPVQRGGQGPKTRAFQRNMLAPETVNELSK